MIITPSQCVNARAMLGLERSALAVLARMSPHLIANFESGEWLLTENKLRNLRAALEAAGIEFFAEGVGSPGVRLRKMAASVTSNKDQLTTIASRYCA